MPDTISKTLPLQASKNTRTIVPFCDMPDEYTLIERQEFSEYPRAEELQKIFDADPSVRTIMVLYDQDDRLRSVYQSRAKFNEYARNYPEESSEEFHYAAGEKLVNLVMEVACDLSAYGQNNVMVPQGASVDEVRDIASNRARDISHWDDAFGFEEDWSTVEGLRINRLVEVVQEPGKQNWPNNIVQDIPVEFAPSRYGVDVVEMLKAAERGTVIVPEVFMYATARQAQAAGEDFDPKFMRKLESNAQVASENVLFEFIKEHKILSHDIMAVDATGDVHTYSAGSVWFGAELKIYRDKQDADRLVLAMPTPDRLKSTHPNGIYMLNTDFQSIDVSLTVEEFQQQYVPLPKLEAEEVFAKHFGLKRFDDNEKTNEEDLSLPNEAAAQERDTQEEWDDLLLGNGE